MILKIFVGKYRKIYEMLILYFHKLASILLYNKYYIYFVIYIILHKISINILL